MGDLPEGSEVEKKAQGFADTPNLFKINNEIKEFRDLEQIAELESKLKLQFEKSGQLQLDIDELKEQVKDLEDRYKESGGLKCLRDRGLIKEVLQELFQAVINAINKNTGIGLLASELEDILKKLDSPQKCPQCGKLLIKIERGWDCVCGYCSIHIENDSGGEKGELEKDLNAIGIYPERWLGGEKDKEGQTSSALVDSPEPTASKPSEPKAEPEKESIVRCPYCQSIDFFFCSNCESEIDLADVKKLIKKEQIDQFILKLKDFHTVEKKDCFGENRRYIRVEFIWELIKEYGGLKK